MAAAPPPDEPDVKITLRVTEDELAALERLADESGRAPQLVLREALQTAILINGLIAEGCTILYRKPDGSTGEIGF